MASSDIWKPVTNDGNPAFLTDINNPRTPPVLVLADGTRVTGSLKSSHEGRHKYTFPPSVLGKEGAHIEYNGQSYPIENTNQSYEGMGPGWKARDKGSVGDTSSGSGGQFGFDTIGEFGVAPTFIGDQFPDAVQTKFDPIPGAAQDYTFIDPIKFGREFGPFQRSELTANLAQAKGFAMDVLDTEFQGLASFVPRSAMLKRQELGLDTAFNQALRLAQVQGAIPDVVRDLNQQAADARTYASGEAPNDVINRGLEIGLRSEAADIAATSGFGVASSASQKISNLMSARERIGLSQYGNQLLSQNAAQRQQLLLAPTSYSDAGAQIGVMPTISGGQAQVGNFAAINAETLISAREGFQAAINQSQFGANLIQRTQEFNASNTLQNAQFNANNLNNFALSYFNYLNSYVNSVAGAAQTNINTGVAIDQQEAARNEANKQKDKTQTGNDIVSGIAGVGAIIGGISGIFGGFGGGGGDSTGGVGDIVGSIPGIGDLF